MKITEKIYIKRIKEPKKHQTEVEREVKEQKREGTSPL